MRAGNALYDISDNLRQDGATQGVHLHKPLMHNPKFVDHDDPALAVAYSQHGGRPGEYLEVDEFGHLYESFVFFTKSYSLSLCFLHIQAQS